MVQIETAVDDHDRVATLKCAVCSWFWERLQPMRNYRPAFIEGTSNVRTSTFKDHADTDTQKYTMVLFNSLASKFELHTQLLSAKIKMSLHVPNCVLNDFYVLTLPTAMGSDIVQRNLQRHLYASLWIVILCQLGVLQALLKK